MLLVAFPQRLLPSSDKKINTKTLGKIVHGLPNDLVRLGAPSICLMIGVLFKELIVPIDLAYCLENPASFELMGKLKSGASNDAIAGLNE